MSALFCVGKTKVVNSPNNLAISFKSSKLTSLKFHIHIFIPDTSVTIFSLHRSIEVNRKKGDSFILFLIHVAINK